MPNRLFRYFILRAFASFKKKLNFMAPFYGWGSTALRLVPSRVNFLLVPRKVNSLYISSGVQMCKFNFAKNLTTVFILVIEIVFAKIIYFISWTSCKKKCKTATLANYVKTVAILASMQKELQKLLKTLQFLADLLITSSADCISFLKHFLTIST